MNRKPILLIILWMAIIALPGAACSLTNNARETVENIAATTAPLATQITMPETTEEPLAASEEQPASTLDKLQSYRSLLTIKLDGISQNGTPLIQQLEIQNEKVSAQNAFHARISNSETDEKSFEFFSIGSQTFIYNPSDTSHCLMFTTNENNTFEMGLTRPEEFFDQVEKGDLIQSAEQVNGIQTDHYRVDHFNFGIGVLSSQTSEVWLATEGGYIVRFKGEAKGNAVLGKINGDAVIIWEYNLTDVNQIDEITLPAECAAQLQANQDVPVPPNASEKDIYGGVIAFSSPDTPASVAQYYRAELSANGWTITDESSDDPLFILKTRKDDRKLQIMISPGVDENSTAVIITEDE